MNATADAVTSSPISLDLVKRRSLHLQFICALFFLSGFPALIYQLVWQRALFRIIGVNIESVTIVVTAFMLGLGLGSLLGGRLSRGRGLSLLLLLAFIELLTAAFGLHSLSLFETVGKGVSGAPLAIIAPTTLLLVIVPTLLMGATLPLLVAYFVNRSGDVGDSVGLLYFVNTLGAGIACFACILFIFPWMGMQSAVHVAVVSNLIIAVGALVAFSNDRKSETPTQDTVRTTEKAAIPRREVLPFTNILALGAITGFVSLSYEIFFFRIMSYATGSSPIAFAATLGVFLVGLAYGSRAGGRVANSLQTDQLTSWMFKTLLGACFFGVALLPLMTVTAPFFNVHYLIAAIIVFLVAKHLGSILPCLAELGITADNDTGLNTSKLYLANIVGSASGSVFTGFVLMEYLSILQVAQVLCAMGLSGAIVLVWLSRNRTRKENLSATRKSLIVIISGALGIVSIPLLASNVLESLQWKNMKAAQVPFAQVVENRSGILTVDRAGSVFGNGMYDGKFRINPADDSNAIVRPFTLGLFHPSPTDVLMIGLSSGSWAQVIANHPDVKHFTIVEINRGYREMIERYPLVSSLLDNPKVTIVFDDGRRWLQNNPDMKFDAIYANSTYHFRANATNLLSADFLSLIKKHMKDGAIYSYNTTGSTRVQRTGCTVFAGGIRFLNELLVSESNINADFGRWQSLLENYTIDGRNVFNLDDESHKKALATWIGLQEAMKSGDPTTSPVEPCRSILQRTQGQDLVTDDNMGTEWRYLWSAVR